MIFTFHCHFFVFLFIIVGSCSAHHGASAEILIVKLMIHLMIFSLRVNN